MSTVGPTGRPHPIAVWFWWDGDSILIYSEPETRKIRDLRQNSAVALALETREEGEAVIFFEGEAELTAEPTTALMPEGFGEKYEHLFPGIDSSPAKMAAQFSQPI